ncbi:MAG: hypothetical protein U1E65_27370 [Myxococcota bacterium]
MSVASLSGRSLRLVGQATVEADRGCRRSIAAGEVLSEANLEARNAQREVAKNAADLADGVEIASSVASAVKSGLGAGQAVAAQQQQAAFVTAAAQGSEAKLLATPIGDGKSLGDRFGAAGARALLREDLGARPGEDRLAWGRRVGVELAVAGFSPGEVEGIWQRAQGGTFGLHDAADFVWSNQKTPDEALAEARKDQILDSLRSETVSAMNRHAGEAAKRSRDVAAGLEQAKASAEERLARAAQAGSSHDAAIGDALLRAQQLNRRR